MRYLAVVLAVFVAGCAPEGKGLLASLEAALWPNRPATVLLSADLPTVPRAEAIGSLQVTSLIDGGSRRFEAVPYGSGVRVRQDNGCVWTRTSDWFSPSDSWANCGNSLNWHTARANVRQRASLYPLRVGSQGRYERRATSHTGLSYRRETVCRVTGAEDLVRPGFPNTPAYVVSCDDGKRVRTTWYAPGTGPVAFTQVSDEDGLEESWIRTR